MLNLHGIISVSREGPTGRVFVSCFPGNFLFLLSDGRLAGNFQTLWLEIERYPREPPVCVRSPAVPAGVPRVLRANTLQPLDAGSRDFFGVRFMADGAIHDGLEYQELSWVYYTDLTLWCQESRFWGKCYVMQMLWATHAG